MDKRVILENGSLLHFKNMPECQIDSFIGCGSNAMVYMASYQDSSQPDLRHNILLKELFPYDRSGRIFREEDGSICCRCRDGESKIGMLEAYNAVIAGNASGRIDVDLSELILSHFTSFDVANKVHSELKNRHPGEISMNINTEELSQTRYSWLEYYGGRTLYYELKTSAENNNARKALTDDDNTSMPDSKNDLSDGDNVPPLNSSSLLIHIRRMLGFLDCLEIFHKEHYLHLDISPDNLLISGNGRKERMSVIDYNSVHKLEDLNKGKYSYLSAKEGFSAPELLLERYREIDYSTDLFSLTTVFYYCLTGKKINMSAVLTGHQQFLPESLYFENGRQAVLSQSQNESGAPSLADTVPQTAVYMLKRILMRGLSFRKKYRYRDISQMRTDLEELKDRIEGRGITHWALWENGRNTVRNIIAGNPAFDYLADEDKFFPVLMQEKRSGEDKAESARHHGAQNEDNKNDNKDGNKWDIARLYDQLTCQLSQKIIMTGRGGMGKTSLLLKIACNRKIIYRENQPAILYIPLYGYDSLTGDYIKKTILTHLKIKSETNTYEMALSQLLEILNSPSHTSKGDRPKAVLLLDGLNEARGDISRLKAEIDELSTLKGVNILLTSRSLPESGETDQQKIQLPADPFFSGSLFRQVALLEICELELDEVKNRITSAKEGVILPEPAMLEALRTPMLLSLYLRTLQQEDKQLFLKNADDLLNAYLKSLLNKVENKNGDDSGKYWSARAAVEYVLPQIATLQVKKGNIITDADLLPCVSRCYKKLTSKGVKVLFPDWISHIEEIKSGQTSAQGWYNLIIRRILWKQMGLLIYEENSYRINHQILAQYLYSVNKKHEKVFVRIAGKRMLAGLLAGLCLTGAFYHAAYKPYIEPWIQTKVHKTPYDTNLAQAVLTTGLETYADLSDQYDSMKSYLECIQNSTLTQLSEFQLDSEQSYGFQLTCLQTCLKDHGNDYSSLMSGYDQKLLSSGQVMPWSEQAMDTELLEEYGALPAQRASEYESYMQEIDDYISDLLEKEAESQSDNHQSDYEDLLQNHEDCLQAYVSHALAALECDAALTGKYYQLLVEPEIDAMDTDEKHQYNVTLSSYEKQNEITASVKEETSLEDYQEKCRKAWDQVASDPMP